MKTSGKIVCDTNLEPGLLMADGKEKRFGPRRLAALAMLTVAWFALNTLAMQAQSGQKVGLSFWSMLAVLNSPVGVPAGLGGVPGGTGIYGVLAVVALLTPLLPLFWQDRRAHLGGSMPLAFMLMVAFMAYMGISGGMDEAQGAVGAFDGAAAAKLASMMQSEMVRRAMQAMSLGAGFYLSLAASLYLAAKSTMTFLSKPR